MPPTAPTATAPPTAPAAPGFLLAAPPSCPTCVPPVVDERPAITSPEAAAAQLLPVLADHDRERCVVLLLDTRHRLLEVRTVSVGSIDHTFMAPREVYRDALLGNAAAIVLGHNHPSGDPEPSEDDVAVTRRLAAAGRLLGLELLDHLVVGRRSWTSLARRGGLHTDRG